MAGAAERYDKGLRRNMALILMALLIGSFAYLMITAIFQTISNLS